MLRALFLIPFAAWLLLLASSHGVLISSTTAANNLNCTYFTGLGTTVVGYYADLREACPLLHDFQ